MNDDLISRGALLEEFDWVNRATAGEGNYEEDLRLLIKRVAEMPAEDAEIVRHGKWKPYYEPMECFVDVYLNTEIRDVHMGWICSECGRYEQHGTTEEMPYCHCGAKMDAEAEA